MARTCTCCREMLEGRDAVESGVCDECRHKLGVVPMGAPRRPPKPCQRCNGMVFVRAIPREHTGEYNLASPMVVTHDVKVISGLFSAATERVHPRFDGHGRLELYICRGCGFVEWYVERPDAIPIGPQYMTQLVDYTSDTPYR